MLFGMWMWIVDGMGGWEIGAEGIDPSGIGKGWWMGEGISGEDHCSWVDALVYVEVCNDRGSRWTS